MGSFGDPMFLTWKQNTLFHPLFTPLSNMLTWLLKSLRTPQREKPPEAADVTSQKWIKLTLLCYDLISCRYFSQFVCFLASMTVPRFPYKALPWVISHKPSQRFSRKEALVTCWVWGRGTMLTKQATWQSGWGAEQRLLAFITGVRKIEKRGKAQDVLA